MTRSRLLPVIGGSCAALALCGPVALAGGGPESALLIINPADPVSMHLGNYYKNARGIPDSAVLYMNPDAPNHAAFAQTHLPALFGHLAGAGHGGMDYMEDYRLIKCLREGLPTDMNVYDAAALSSLVGATVKSVASRSRPVDIPDFTRGRWKTNPKLDLVRAYLSYFPSSAWSYPSHVPGGDDGARLVPEILDIVPRNGRRVYDMRKVVDVVFDAGSCFEVQPEFGRPVICALGRLGGHPVAVVANQPLVLAGSIDADAADKAAHFITVADSFHLPLVFLSDNPGVLPGSKSEKQAILRKGARMYAAQTLATSPKFEVTLRKAYGFGSMVMGMIPFDGQSAVFAFPGVTMGAMGAAAMSRAKGSDDDEAAMLIDEARTQVRRSIELLEERKRQRDEDDSEIDWSQFVTQKKETAASRPIASTRSVFDDVDR